MNRRPNPGGPSTRRRATPWSAVVLLGSALAGCGPGADAANGDHDRSAVAVDREQIAVAAVESLAAGPTLSGRLVPERQANLRAEVAGTVVRINVEEGQRVVAGQVLVRLDDAALVDAELSARSAVRTATEALAVARRNAERAARLAGVGALAERDLEQARWNVTNAEATLADADARHALTRKQLQKTVIRAPFTGAISERPASAGDVVQTGNPLVSVVDLRTVRLEATVPVSALEALEVGDVVTLTGTGVGPIEGRVRLINPVVDPATSQVRVIISLPNLKGRLVGGLFAEGRVATERRSALAVPIPAVDVRGASPSVRRIRDGVVELIAVELGIRDEARNLVEIRSGLAPGDTVLVSGSTGILPGTPVVVRKE